MSPCDCIIIEDGAGYPYVDCVGPDVTQDVLNRVITAIRRENNQTLGLIGFNIKFTRLTELDLTPFEGENFRDEILLESNFLLSRVFGPDLNTTNWNPITTYALDWTYNNFQDEGLQTALSYFVRAELGAIYLRGNKLTGSLGQEFLPGFSDLSNVNYLDLGYNNIRVLGGGQFRGLSRLSSFYMNNNRLEEVGDDAFLIDQPNNNHGIFVYLMNNSLTDESFHPSTGISNMTLAQMFANNNHFTKVIEAPFLNFLEIDPRNFISFAGNPIWCSPEMKWIKDRREEFETQLRGLDCINDPGETVYTSFLVDG